MKPQERYEVSVKNYRGALGDALRTTDPSDDNWLLHGKLVVADVLHMLIEANKLDMFHVADVLNGAQETLDDLKRHAEAVNQDNV